LLPTKETYNAACKVCRHISYNRALGGKRTNGWARGSNDCHSEFEALTESVVYRTLSFTIIDAVQSRYVSGKRVSDLNPEEDVGAAFFTISLRWLNWWSAPGTRMHEDQRA
jgi:hypothetical protein